MQPECIEIQTCFQLSDLVYFRLKESKLQLMFFGHLLDRKLFTSVKCSFLFQLLVPLLRLCTKFWHRTKEINLEVQKPLGESLYCFLESFVFFSHFLDFSHSNTGTVLTAGNKFFETLVRILDYSLSSGRRVVLE